MAFSTINASAIEEPELLFGGSSPARDPKTGLALYGPYSFQKTSIKVGIVGDTTTIGQIKTILNGIRNKIEGPVTHPTWTPNFPGTSRPPFKCDILFDDKWTQQITDDDVDKLRRFNTVQERIFTGVETFIKYITNLTESEENFDVIICAPPIMMMKYCIRPEDSHSGIRPKKPKQKRVQKRLDLHQQNIIDFMPEYKESYYRHLAKTSSDNFHHLLKARMMAYNTPTQFMLPHTLAAYTSNTTKMQDEATFSWNFSVALMYKAGARLWRPTIPQRTCFIGISFYRKKEIYGGDMGTSLAQIFTPEGEGLVLRGERVRWTRGKSPHLEKDAAKRLVEKSIDLYEKQTRTKPTRVVIHKSSKFWDDEQEGFKEGLNGIHSYDFVAISQRSRGIRFFRAGCNPVLRGTMIKFPDKSWVLYTKGYVPYMKVYPGPHVPYPLEIMQHIGQAQPETISKEILLLTKINWNSADFSSMEPMTLQFSRKVGDILKELPSDETPQSKYLYYM